MPARQPDIVHRLRHHGLAVLGALSLQLGLSPVHAPATMHRQAAAQPAVQVTVGILALDAQGRPALGSRPQDLDVTVDGTPRAVTSVVRVYRGPGARAAAGVALRQGVPPGVSVAAEPSRAILVVIDETSIGRGEEVMVESIVTRLLDRLGPEDRVTIVTVPLRSARVALTTDRAALNGALKKVTGRAERFDASVAVTPIPDLETLVAAESIERPRGERAVTDEAAAERGRGEPPPVLAGDPGAISLDDAETALPRGGNLVLAALGRLLRGVARFPGPKTVVLLSRGLMAPASADEASLVLAAAAEGQAALHVLRPAAVAWQAGRVNRAVLDMLAAEGGGAVIAVDRRSDSAIERLVARLAGFELLALEAGDPERDGRLHRLAVALRPGGTVLAPQRVAARAGGLSPGITPVTVPEAAPEAPLPVTAGPVTRPARRPAPEDAELPVVLARMTEYAVAYERVFSSVVAEERYEQRVRRATRGAMPLAGDAAARRLRSDFLMVASPATGGWIPFRDVFEVDGKPVRDREARLQRLFLERPATAIDEARQITDESARYNVGSVVRNVNVPTLPLLFLQPAYRPRFTFTRAGEETIDGLRVWRVDYEEMSRPTVVRSDKDGDVPVGGTCWVDPISGRIVRTLLRSRLTRLDMETTVDYQPNDALGLWVPAEMKESYENYPETITARAVYSNFRRFQVIVDEKIKEPKR